ncbi:MAG TPA: DUF4126 domain-containing protein [Gemmatimonadaceae bacterium]|nr:DUF4126 domain-containing protein [Gemmatimonadaceae bacterium]
MSPLDLLGLTLGTSFAAGLNLYATVAAAGLFQRFGWVELPAGLQVLANPVVLGIALVLFVVEFVADKIPLVDSVWQAVHTFVRPPAAMILSVAALGHMDPGWQVAAALLAGSVALTSHGAKTSARAAANTSPEPVSNWALSFSEDGLAIFLTWLATEHPIIAVAIVLVLLVVAVVVIRMLFRFVRTRVIPLLRRGERLFRAEQGP